MSAELLLEQFDRLAEAPDAIPRLRRFILDLAVRGKLVQQDPATSSADGKLAVLGRTRNHFVSTGKLKAVSAAEPLAGDVPFVLPPGWCWASPDQLSALVNHALTIGPFGSSLLKSDYRTEGVPLVFVADVTAEFSRPITRFVTASKAHDLRAHTVKAGDLVITKMGDPPGYTAIYPVARGDGIITADCVKWTLANEVVNTRYLYFAIRARVLADQIVDITKGAAHQKVSLRRFRGIRIPLPPLAEQHRIVAKVDELMVLCDRLEAAQAERERRRDRLVAASLHRLNTATDPAAFRAAASFHLRHLPRLASRPDQVSKLRASALDLAVRGKLVRQEPNDEAAFLTLDRIKRTRAELLKAKVIPKPTKLPSLAGVEVPFQVPDGWQWAMLGQLCYQVSDGPHFSPSYASANEGVPFLSTRNIRVDRFDLVNLKYVSRQDHERFCQRTRPERGDILYTKGGTTGIARVNDLEFDFSVWVHVAVLKIAKELVDAEYVALALNSPFCYAQAQAFTHGTSNSDLGLTRMVKILLPMPPLAEQRRVVVKVEQLMALCDGLEATLASAKSGSANLLEASIREATNCGRT